jgi:glutamate carboxypeptidase
MHRIAIAGLVLMTTAAVLAQPDDARLMSTVAAAVEANHDAALALLERVVNINSGTMNFAGVRQVGDVFSAELTELGFTTRWIDGTPFNRAGHLIAERAGNGPRVLLIGHLDTVFEADSSFQRFERLTPTTARGPGIIDMKGGDVIIVSALKALARAGQLDRLSVTVVMTGDEEDPGEPLDLARKPLRDAAQGKAVAIGFEDGAGDPRLAIVSRRGFTGWTLKVSGQPAHSSQVFTETVGAGAIYEASRVLKAMYDRLSTEALLSVNPGVLLGGTTVDLDAPHSKGTAFGKTNVVAGTAVATGDIRAYTREQLEKAKAVMQSIASTSLPHTSAELTFDDSYPPMGPTDGNRRLLAMYDQASRDLGLGAVGPTDPRAAGAADVAFVGDLVPQVIDGVGLMGRADHTPEETADLSTLTSQTTRAALLLARLAGQD